MRRLLDTNILIYFLNLKDENAATLIADNSSVISVLSRTELLMGSNPEDIEKSHKLLNIIQSLPIDNKIADIAADLIRDNAKNKKRIADILIAATALAYHLELVTANIKDFNKIPNLKTIGFKLE